MPDRVGLELPELGGDPLGEPHRAPEIARRHDDRELLTADAAHHVRRPHRRAQDVCDPEQQLVADAVPVHVVDALEVVQVEHHEGDGVVLDRRAHELLAQAVVESPVVVEAGERVGGGLVLEPRADVGVVDRERCRVAEAPREQELLLGEADVLADAVDVERALEPAARDQGHGDQRLRVDGRARDEADARVEVRPVGEDGLAVLDGPAGDALVEREGRVHDLFLPLAAGEHRLEHALRLVGFVDVDRLVRHQLRERVRDPLEQCGRALLGEDVVEDLGEAPVWLRSARGDDAHLRARLRFEGCGGRIGHARGPRLCHRTCGEPS